MGLDTYETIGDKEGPTYANVKQTNRKSQIHREEALTHEDETGKQKQSKDGYCMPLESSPPDATSNKLEAHGVVDVKTAGKQENRDHVYAVVQKENKGRDTAASFHATTPCSKRLEPAIRPNSAAEPVNRSSFADPANHSDVRCSSVKPVNHSQDALSGDGKKDQLYAVVDKANKKTRPPQVCLLGLCVFIRDFSFLRVLIKNDCSLDLSFTTIISRLSKNKTSYSRFRGMPR